jgi:hypothetical protein
VRAVTSGEGSGVGVGGSVGVAVGRGVFWGRTGATSGEHAVVRSDKAEYFKNFLRESFMEKPARKNYYNGLFCGLYPP